MADHVPYEIAMMRATHDGLSKGVPLGTCSNAYIESFAIHARSLVDFLTGKYHSKASHFTSKYTPFLGGKVPKRLIGKLNQQIAHITENRANTVEEKLNGGDINELRLLIDAEIARFLDHLQPEYRDVWDTKKGHLRRWG